MAKTFYHRSTVVLSGIHVADHEKDQPTTAGSVVLEESSSFVGGESRLSFLFTTPAAEPNTADWPNGLYRCIMEITTAGADISYGLRAAGTATGHFARVNSDLTSDLETIAQTQALFTGTGVKTASVTWDPAAGAAGDRFECLIAGTRAASHGSQTLAIALDAPDASETNGGISDGPWTVAAAFPPPYRVPRHLWDLVRI